MINFTPAQARELASKMSTSFVYTQDAIDALLSLADQLEQANLQHIAAFEQLQDADTNAPWLSDAHALCADHGIPPGHISARLEFLREKLAAPVLPAPLPTMEDAIAAGDGVLHHSIDYWQERCNKLEAAALKVIEMNRQEADGRMGRAVAAETWSCVKVLREALADAPVVPAPWVQGGEVEQAITAANKKYARVLRAAIEFLAVTDERHDTIDGHMKYVVPYRAVNALRAALGGTAQPVEAQLVPLQEDRLRQCFVSAKFNFIEGKYATYEIAVARAVEKAHGIKPTSTEGGAE